MRRSAIGLTLLLSSCGSAAGLYGHARTYVPLEAEQAYLARATPATVADVQRVRPDEQPYVGWFGVVLEPPVAEDGAHRVRLSHRAHQERHLCRDATDDSCRVTVSERDLGTFVARLHVRAEDLQDNPDRMAAGSLVRVYGRSVGEVDADGSPIIEGEWYRHWPRFTFVTTRSATDMRR